MNAMTVARITLIAPLLALSGCAMHHLERNSEQFAATPPEAVTEQNAMTGSIYQAGHDVPLFENSVARRVGDIITIVLEEKTDAAKSASTTTAKNSAVALPGAKLLGNDVTINGNKILSASLDNKSSFDGTGDSKQSNALSGNVTVTVAQRLSNGNLLVRGQKWIMINQGREFVRIQGIVRPVDISPSNTVPSYKVADASIAYGSQGVIEAANSKSLLARFFDSKWMPF
jgi:flagellar L-ring protein precursor FlgH